MAITGIPDVFTWGVATAAYQIEGAIREDGRGWSIWDEFSHTPGKVKNGDTGDVACDHYHRWQEDLDLIQSLEVNAYRFSVSWPRIDPLGNGRINPAGLDFYDRLVDGILERDLEPWLTLYHWDLPWALQEKGGWPNRDTVNAFSAYAEAVANRLGDRVDHWITINEPWCAAFLSHTLGVHAPGHRSWSEGLATAHHLLLAHGEAVPIIRELTDGAQVGIAPNPTTCYPATDSESDQAAAWRADGNRNRWFFDPLAGRGYPEDIVELMGNDMPEIREGDLETITTPIDFMAVNFYNPDYIADAPDAPPLRVMPVDRPGLPHAGNNWIIEPRGLTDTLVRIATDYGFGPLYITENGSAWPDVVSKDGQVHDLQRIEYLEAHLQAVAEAIAKGADVRGYFGWSLMDNFEWAEGYSQRFGLVFVDYPTQKRIIKDSGRWYAQHIR